MLFTCVGQREGGHGHITEFAGHIIHKSTWRTVFSGERSKTTNAASMKAQRVHTAPASASLTHAV